MMVGTGKRIVLEKIAYTCFYLAVIVEVLIVLIDKSAYTNPIEGRLFQVTFLLFTIKAVLTKYSKREYLIVLLFLLLGAVSYFVTGRNEIVRIVMFIAACKDVDMERCMKLVFYMTLAGCIIIMLLSLSGIYGAVSLTEDYGRGGVETRYILGMGHPNALQCMVWALTVLFLYLYGERLKWYWYFLILLINLGSYFLTGSRTGLLVAVLTVSLQYMISAGNFIIRKLVSIGCILITLFSILLSIIIAGNAYRVYEYAWHYSENYKMTLFTLFMVKLNSILNGRIRILVENTRFEGTTSTWHLFSAPENNYYFDMGWIRMFYWYGIIPACIMIIVLFMLIKFCYYNKNYSALVMIMSFSIYSISEAHAVSVYIARNYILFLLGMYWTTVLHEIKT